MSTTSPLLRLILGLYLLIALSYALITPPFEASDELWHYPMIQHLGNGNPLPVQVFDPAQAGPWKQEASQPPLYYYLGAALTFWIDTSDMERVRWLNPHVDNGVITSDGNTNLAIHPDQFDPNQGTLLAVRIVRLFSVLLGAWTVYLTYLLAREVVPARQELALGAAAINAFTPMFLFISGAVNNDNLAIPLASLGVLWLVRLVTRPPQTRQSAIKQTLLLGVVTGLAILTKQGTFALLPLALGTFAIYQWTVTPSPFTWGKFGRLLGKTGAQFALLLVPVVLIAGWWYWRNILLYGDFLGWNAFIAVLGQRETPAPLAQLWQERWGFMLSYWGLFGGVNIPLWTWVYYLLNGLVLLAVPGFLLYLGQVCWRWWQDHGRVLLATHLSFLPKAITFIFDFVRDNFGLIVTLIFAGGVVYGLIQWATTTWSSQGRLVFTAISALNILLVLGLAGWMPERWARPWLGAISGFLLIVAALAPWLIIRPAYTPPPVVQGDTSCTAVVCLPDDDSATFSQHLRLLGYEITPSRTPLQPGDSVDVTLEWLVINPSDRDWSVFVHLHDPVLGVPIAQRDMYLGQGLRPTSLLQAGDKLTNRYQLVVPDTAVAPADLALMIGLYDYQNGERLVLPNQTNRLTLADLPLASRPGDTPNPVQINFENKLQLIGYDLTPRRLPAGATTDLTLFWQPLTNLDKEYTFFAQIVDPDTTRWASADVPQPTTGWSVGETYSMTIPLTLREDAPAGIYPLRLGVYLYENEQFQNLQRVTPDGRLTDDFINLTQVRVLSDE
jgi:hypothetical protein